MMKKFGIFYSENTHMRYIISRYNHDLSWLRDYTNDAIIYDRSDNQTGYLFLDSNIKTIIVPNLGSDIADKFKFIIDNYENLPEVAVYTKANIFKYIKREEFDKVKDNKVFTPLLTQTHRTYNDANGQSVCYYKDGMYYEVNNYWFLIGHPPKYAKEINEFFKMDERDYNCFAPGSNYILTKENILKHSKETYKMLRSWLTWATYPSDCHLMERNLWYLWR